MNLTPTETLVLSFTLPPLAFFAVIALAQLLGAGQPRRRR